MTETDTIRTEVEQSGGCRRRLSVTIDAGHVAHEFEEIVRRFARTIRLPGFRRGKVPPALAQKRFTREIEEEVRDHLVREGLREGFSRHSLTPLHDPVIEGG